MGHRFTQVECICIAFICVHLWLELSSMHFMGGLAFGTSCHTVKAAWKSVGALSGAATCAK
jgi:hypothetical protein